MYRDHLKNAHRPPQCERCYEIFQSRDELHTHRRAGSCEQNCDLLKEGIDDSQFEKIENLLRARGGMRTNSLAKRMQLDYDNWFAIWRILFPYVDEPPDPCKLSASTFS